MASSSAIRWATEPAHWGRRETLSGTSLLIVTERVSPPSLSLLAMVSPTSEREPEMPTYLMLTNLTAEGVRTLKNNPSRVAEVNKEVEQIGARVVAQYATLGQYDFVTVVEAPDEKTMAKVSVELGSRGTMTSQTLTAISADDLAGSL